MLPPHFLTEVIRRIRSYAEYDVSVWNYSIPYSDILDYKIIATKLRSPTIHFLQGNSTSLNWSLRSLYHLTERNIGMKKPRDIEEQHAENYPRVGNVSRKMSISKPSFYNWKKKFTGPGITELRQLGGGEISS